MKKHLETSAPQQSDGTSGQQHCQDGMHVIGRGRPVCVCVCVCGCEKTYLFAHKYMNMHNIHPKATQGLTDGADHGADDHCQDEAHVESHDNKHQSIIK